MSTPEEPLVEAIVAAVKQAVHLLYANNPGHQFYYISLVTTGEGLAPCLTAWSKQALDAAVEAASEDDRQYLKWSYAESPFFEFGTEYFGDVKRLFLERPDPVPQDEAAWDAEVGLRFSAMEEAMSALDAAGVFGTGAERAGVLVNVEVQPPDATNVDRARRLNPAAALVDYLREAAEP